MDADTPKLSNPKHNITTLRRREFEILLARHAAERARKIEEYDALNRPRPGNNLIAFPTRP